MISHVNGRPVAALLSGREEVYLCTLPDGSERVVWGKSEDDAREESAARFGVRVSMVKVRRY